MYDDVLVGSLVHILLYVCGQLFFYRGLSAVGFLVVSHSVSIGLGVAMGVGILASYSSIR